MSERVCPVVVTNNRLRLPERCLDALAEQVRPPDALLVRIIREDIATLTLPSPSPREREPFRSPRPKGERAG